MILLGFQILFVFCMCYAVVSDFRELLIPNWIIVTLVAAFPLFAVGP
jgi:Flp pilus assembly protein protease CpaA